MVKTFETYLEESKTDKVASQKYVVSAVVDQGKSTQNPVFDSRNMEAQSDISKAIFFDHIERAEEALVGFSSMMRRKAGNKNLKFVIEKVQIDTVYKRMNPIEDQIKNGTLK